ncbi:MAG: helix-turn-helix transcriptional regulator [Chloroflexi bacterium]|nr:helix-turn-helix transcriptional regulator [Chloroflexota bacterium]
MAVRRVDPGFYLGRLPRVERLTRRQREVLLLVVAGCSNKQIAARLKISEQTAKWHVSRLFALLEVPNRPALVRVVVADRGRKRG